MIAYVVKCIIPLMLRDLAIPVMAGGAGRRTAIVQPAQARSQVNTPRTFTDLTP